MYEDIEIKKIIAILLLLGTFFTILQASEENKQFGMFATVVNLSHDEGVKVRLKPNYSSKVLGLFHSESLSDNVDYFAGGMQVEYCEEVNNTRWCKVSKIVNIDIGLPTDGADGWVDAKYLKFSDAGYINVLNRKSDCDYVLKCKTDQCLVLDYESAKWIDKKFLGVEKGAEETSTVTEEDRNGIVDEPMFCFNHFRKVLYLYSEKQTTALFGQVVNIVQNDTLNIRAKPNYKAKKIAALIPGLYIGVDSCIQVGKSTWCKTHWLVQNGEEYKDGWVNARYLRFSNHGYVNIVGKENNCFYALKCRDNKNTKECLVVYDLNYDYEKDRMIEIKSKWVDRNKLKGESMFGAASNNKEINPEGGYCTKGKMIDEYLKKVNILK